MGSRIINNCRQFLYSVLSFWTFLCFFYFHTTNKKEKFHFHSNLQMNLYTYMFFRACHHTTHLKVPVCGHLNLMQSLIQRESGEMKTNKNTLKIRIVHQDHGDRLQPLVEDKTGLKKRNAWIDESMLHCVFLETHSGPT